MKSRQRLLGAIRGTEIDRVPWSPFLAYYWESLPEEIQRKGQFAYLQEMGADPLLRGFHTLSRFAYKNCNEYEKRVGNEIFQTIETPVGKLEFRSVFSPSGSTTFVVDHPVKTPEDFKILQYLYEHMEITPDAKDFEGDFRLYGDDALLLPLVGVRAKTAFQSLVEYWVGTENLVYMIYEEPEAMEECLAVMQARDDETVRNALNTSADGFIFWEDSSTTNVSPAIFRKYTMPEINRWGEQIHKAGKLLVHHACGHIRDLLPLMAQTKIDAVESITPPPTGNVTMQRTAELLPERIAMIGGLEPVRLLRESVETVCEDAEALLRDLKGRRLILANADSCPPGVAYEKFLAVSELVRRK